MIAQKHSVGPKMDNLSYDAPQRNTPLIYLMPGLGMAGVVLHIGAHPDDEDVGLMAYMAHKFGVRIVHWSATRGEGGQNRIGSYQGEALGVYRTWESLSARSGWRGGIVRTVL